jgi:hypothetical protein
LEGGCTEKARNPCKWDGTSPCSPPYNLGGCPVMAAQKKYPDELRERAVKMLFEVREREGKGHGEPVRVARQLGVHPEALGPG